MMRSPEFVREITNLISENHLLLDNWKTNLVSELALLLEFATKYYFCIYVFMHLFIYLCIYLFIALKVCYNN